MGLKPTFLAIIILMIGIITVSRGISVRESVRPLRNEEILISDGLFLKSKYPPSIIEAHVLGSLVGVERIIKQANLTPIEELNRIIWHESENDPTAQNPSSSAHGFCQMILSTKDWVAKDILEETEYVIDYENPKDQLQACIYLYENGVPENEWAETMHLWKL